MPPLKPRLSRDQFDSMVLRLTRLNTTTAYKSVLWSNPRSEYESNFKTNAIIKTPGSVSHRYDVISKHYPGYFRCADAKEMDAITARLTQPTFAQALRASVNIQRRREVEAYKLQMRERDVRSAKRDRSDVMTQTARINSSRSASATSRDVASAPCVLEEPRDARAERRRERAKRAPFMEWRDHDYDAVIERNKKVSSMT